MPPSPSGHSRGGLGWHLKKSATVSHASVELQPTKETDGFFLKPAASEGAILEKGKERHGMKRRRLYIVARHSILVRRLGIGLTLLPNVRWLNVPTGLGCLSWYLVLTIFATVST